MLASIPDLHHRVWTFRNWMGEHTAWKNPIATVDALRWCRNESAEATEAYQRASHDYARNNHKSLDLVEELADTAIVLFSALGADYRGWSSPDPCLMPDNVGEQLDLLCMLTGPLAYDYHTYTRYNAHSWMHDVELALAVIALMLGDDFAPAVERDMQRLYRKWYVDKHLGSDVPFTEWGAVPEDTSPCEAVHSF